MKVDLKINNEQIGFELEDKNYIINGENSSGKTQFLNAIPEIFMKV